MRISGRLLALVAYLSGWFTIISRLWLMPYLPARNVDLTGAHPGKSLYAWTCSLHTGIWLGERSGWESGGGIREWLFTPAPRFDASLNSMRGWLCVAKSWGGRRHPKQTGRTIADCFDKEKPLLIPVKATFDSYVEKTLRVSSTCLIKVDHNRYSVPTAAANDSLRRMRYGHWLSGATKSAFFAWHGCRLARMVDRRKCTTKAGYARNLAGSAAEQSNRKARSLHYQLHAAKFPHHHDLIHSDWAENPLVKNCIEQLATASFVDQANNLIFIGGTGTGKTHLAIALAVSAIHLGRRVRFYNAVNLVNQLEKEK